jgi:hypothetical protein
MPGTCMYSEMLPLSLSLCRRSKSSHDPMEGQAYLDVQGPCRIVVSIKGKFIKLMSHCVLHVGN